MKDELSDLVDTYYTKAFAEYINDCVKDYFDFTFENCVKCGKMFTPRLIKPLTICDECSNKLEQELDS